ncbi:MAG: hypothetical protein WBE46_00170 [Dehalococcoidia bacterium]
MRPGYGLHLTDDSDLTTPSPSNRRAKEMKEAVNVLSSSLRRIVQSWPLGWLNN